MNAARLGSPGGGGAARLLLDAAVFKDFISVINRPSTSHLLRQCTNDCDTHAQASHLHDPQRC